MRRVALLSHRLEEPPVAEVHVLHLRQRPSPSRNYLKVLALCHTVITEEKEGEIKYNVGILPGLIFLGGFAG